MGHVCLCVVLDPVLAVLVHVSLGLLLGLFVESILKLCLGLKFSGPVGLFSDPG